MIQVWHFVVHVYLFIPYCKGEKHVFLFVHHLIPWWSIGAFAFGLPPVVAFFWFQSGPQSVSYQRAMAWARMVAFYSLWALYIFWIPLPWPRVAVLIWAIALLKIYRVQRRRRAYQRSLPVPTRLSAVKVGSTHQ